MHRLAENPRQIQILVSGYPDYLQYTDTCQLVVGRVILPVPYRIQPWLKQYTWPKDIQNKLVFYTNPKSRLTINNLELAGLVLGWLVLEYVA